MTDTRKRSDWKAVTLGYDQLIIAPVDASEGRYCLTIPQVQAIMSFAEMMAWRTRWFSDDGWPIDPDVTQAFSDDIIRRLMMSCCCEEPVILHRVTSDGQLQISTDGGGSWTQDPDDPRITVPSVPPIVPPPGVDACCQAAANLLVRYKNFQAAFAVVLLEALGILAIAAAFCAIIAALLLDPGHSTTLIPLIISQAAAFVGMSESTYNDAFTDDIWAQLLCSLIAACSGGQYSDDSVAQLKADFNTNYSGIVRNTFLIINTCLGTLGTNFAASIAGGDPTHCGDCKCDRDNWQFFDGTHGTDLTIGSDEFGDYVRAVGSLTPGGGDARYMIITTHPGATISEDGPCCAIAHIEIEGNPADCATFVAECHTSGSSPTNIATAPFSCFDWVQVQSNSTDFAVRIYFTAC